MWPRTEKEIAVSSAGADSYRHASASIQVTYRSAPRHRGHVGGDRHGVHAVRLHVRGVLLSRHVIKIAGLTKLRRTLKYALHPAGHSAQQQFRSGLGRTSGEERELRPARIALWITVLLGLGFLALQGFEYRYTLETTRALQRLLRLHLLRHHELHAAHVIVGLLMLMYVGIHAALRTTRAERRTALTRLSRSTGTLSMPCGSSSCSCFT